MSYFVDFSQRFWHLKKDRFLSNFAPSKAISLMYQSSLHGGGLAAWCMLFWASEGGFFCVGVQALFVKK